MRQILGIVILATVVGFVGCGAKPVLDEGAGYQRNGNPTATPTPTPTAVPTVASHPNVQFFISDNTVDAVTSYDFGLVPVGTPQSITIMAVDTGPLNLTDLVHSLSSDSPFSLANDNCGTWMIDGLGCAITVIFNPVATMKFTSTLQFKWARGEASAVLALSGTGQAAAPTKPNAPTNLTGSALNKEQVSLSWQDNSANETGFAVYSRRGGVGDFTLAAYANANDTRITITNLITASRYEFYVVAYNDSGPSGFSNTINITMP